MNYLYFLKKRFYYFLLIMSTASISYHLSLYFGREPVKWPVNYCIFFALGFIFLGALLQYWVQQDHPQEQYDPIFGLPPFNFKKILNFLAKWSNKLLALL